MAKARGFPDFHYAMMPHPLSSLTPEQVKEQARKLVPEILEILGVKDGGK